MKKRKKIALVDDNRELTEELKEVLRTDGYDVLALCGSQDAFLRIKKFMPDLILLDLKMPHKSGVEVAEELQGDEDTRNIPIIGVTAHYKKRTGLLEVYGFKKLLNKPVDPEELLQNIESMLYNH